MAWIQLHFNLSNASHWVLTHNSFNYEVFYKSIVDYLEVPGDDEGMQAVKELFNWWDRCVPSRRLFPGHCLPPIDIFHIVDVSFPTRRLQEIQGEQQLSSGKESASNVPTDAMDVFDTE